MFLAISLPSSYSWNEWNVRHFFFSTKTTQPCPQGFSVNGALTCKKLLFWCHSLVKHKILPNLVISNWLMGNNVCAFSQSESGKYFEWIIRGFNAFINITDWFKFKCFLNLEYLRDGEQILILNECRRCCFEKGGACHDLVQSDRFHEESSVGSFPFCVVQ